MKRIFLAVALLVSCAALVACNDGGRDDENPPVEHWTVQRIGWRLAADGGVEYVDQVIEPWQVVNDTSEEREYTIDWLKDMSGTSTFECNDDADSELFALASEAVSAVIVPSEESLLSTDDWRYMASGYEAPLVAGSSDLPFTTSASDKFTLTPMSRYEFGGTVTLKRLSADFRIEMWEENTREVRYIDGRWQGTYFYRLDSETTVSDLE